MTQDFTVVGPVPAQFYPFTRDGRKEYTQCKQCAVMLDDEAEYGDYAVVGSTPEGTTP